jgi:hypothetical protein
MEAFVRSSCTSRAQVSVRGGEFERGNLQESIWDFMMPIFEPMCMVKQTDIFDVELVSANLHSRPMFDHLLASAPFRLVEFPKPSKRFW